MQSVTPVGKVYSRPFPFPLLDKSSMDSDTEMAVPVDSVVQRGVVDNIIRDPSYNPLTHRIVMNCTSNTALASRPEVTKPVRSVARVFADVNSKQPQSYWDYEAVTVQWGDQDRYLIDDRVGRGKYSEVFSGIDTFNNNQRIIIKVLKPVKTKKIKREIKLLQELYGGKNIIKLLDLVRDVELRTPSFIFEYIRNDDHRELYPRLTDLDIRFYLFELLQALHHCHSKGIMHRDVKPHNIMIDHEQRRLTLIDWGLAEFYHPGVSYNCRVASRYYKGPELIVDFQEYDYSLDLWSLGCVMAGMIFEMDVFFHGSDNSDQMVKIVQVLGSDLYEEYLRKYEIEVPVDVERSFANRRFPPRPLNSFIKKGAESKASEQALDLLHKLLRYDHQERLTAEEAMKHPYFDPVRY